MTQNKSQTEMMDENSIKARKPEENFLQFNSISINRFIKLIPQIAQQLYGAPFFLLLKNSCAAFMPNRQRKFMA